MSETWTLFVLLALFYFTEGMWWTPRHAACVFTTLAGRRGIRAPLALSESAASGVLLPPTLVCTGRRFVATSWPVSLSPEGVSSRPFSFIDPFEESDAPERLLSHAEAAALHRRGAQLVLGGQVFARTDSARDAARLHALILDLARVPEGERAGRIREAIDRSLDAREARRRIRTLRRRLRPYTALPALQTANLLVVAPAIAIYFGLVRVWPVLVVAHVALAGLGLLAFLRIDRGPGRARARDRATPALPLDERIYHAVMMLLFPPATPRYPEVISRGLVSDLHPLAVAAAVGRGPGLRSATPAGAVPRDTCRRFLRRLEVFIETPPTPEAGPRGAVERWFAREHLAAVHRALRREGVALESLVSEPSPEPDAHRYCPACHAQYRADAPACPDCPGVRLETFGRPSPVAAER